MDTAIINPFLEATLDVAKTMAMLELQVGKPSIKQGRESLGAVTGLIELNSADHRGSLAISFDADALLTIYKNMLGEEHNDIDEPILDLAGEITNMVCGGAKQRLSAKGYDFDLTQPKILSGNQHLIAHIEGLPVIQLPLTAGSSKIYIEVSLT